MQIKVNIPELTDLWDEFAKDYPAKGKPSSCELQTTPAADSPSSEPLFETLIYYGIDGDLAGILRYFLRDAPVPEPWMRNFVERKGSLTVVVHPYHRRQGIGITLLKEAVKRWPIDFEAQNYTASGAKLVIQFLKRA